MARLNDSAVVAAQRILRPKLSGDRDSTSGFPAWPGAYALAIHLDRTARLRFGRSEELFAPGWYVYAGSARGPGGVGARVRRHMRADKKPHWHVDALTAAADRIVALAIHEGRECEIAARLEASGQFERAMPGFGSSDCTDCFSHLLVWRP